MKHPNKQFGWLIISGLVFLLTASTFAADPVITEKKAAEVNGVSISILTLNNEYRQTLKQKGISEEDIPVDQVPEVKKELLESLINQELLFQECQKNNISVDEENVSSSMSKVKEKFGNEDAYQSALKDANIQESELLTRLRRALAINTLVDTKISPNVIVTDEESKAYYDAHPDSFQKTEKVRASHILVKVDKDDGEAKKVAAKEKIKDIQRRITAGEDFAQLAKENSDCPSSAEGGDLGYFERGKMVPAFEDAAFVLVPGGVSDIVQTEFGYHLIKVTDKTEAGTVAYDDIKTDLQDFMKKQKLSTEVSSLLETLRKDAKIETYL